MKRKIAILLAAGLGVLAFNTAHVSAAEPSKLIYMHESSGLLAVNDTTGYGNMSGGTGTADMTGTAGTAGGTGATDMTGTTGASGAPGTNNSGYIGNPNNFDPNSMGNTNEMYENTNNRSNGYGNINNTGSGGTGANYQTIIPHGLNNKMSGINGRLNLSPDTYIVQDGDSLWLVMGHIKAKLDVLLYIDPSNTENTGNETNAGMNMNNYNNMQNQGSINNNNGQMEDKNNLGMPIYR